ncbi:MAG TPA: penicillin-binding protein 2 [Candidatus Saccharimonadales bacterium]|nr:penicillin-binding protein 2 [Candidatus Saccharimonadales bacterium]
MNPSNRKNRLQNTKSNPIIGRIRFIYGLLVIICALIILRLFQLQIIQHNYYQQAANSSQIKQYALPAQRGIIYGLSNGGATPLVLNQTTYTLFADPADITNPSKVASQINSVIGGSVSYYVTQMKTKGTQYIVLNDSISQSQQTTISNLNIFGIGETPQQQRIYPNGSLASQVLGFVNSSGQGQFGIEQYYNQLLSGTQGSVKGITDAQGNLLYNKDNIIKQPINGSNITLTINLPIQEQVEKILAAQVQKFQQPAGSTQPTHGSVIVMNPNNGNVVAMANYPTYNPQNYQQYANNESVYQNNSVSSVLEPGSVTKTLTTAAALNQGAVTENQSFYDPGSWNVDGSTISDVSIDGGAQTRNIESILVNSLNTGAVWMLMQMGGGQINQQARDTWYNYLVNKFNIGKLTGIQQPDEEALPVTDPNSAGAVDLQYAEMSFGQGIDISPIEFIAAESAILNGGTYYQPNLVQSVTNTVTNQTTTVKPKILKTNVIKPTISQQIQQLMEGVYTADYPIWGTTPPRSGYITGGKTGTAQVEINGAYSNTIYNGTYVGFIGRTKPDYVIFVQIYNPLTSQSIYDTAGKIAAAPVFGAVTDVLANQGYVN